MRRLILLVVCSALLYCGCEKPPPEPKKSPPGRLRKPGESPGVPNPPK